VNDRDVSASVAPRARIALWYAEGIQKRKVAARAGVSRPAVDMWLSRYETEGIGGFVA
jgi:transposase